VTAADLTPEEVPPPEQPQRADRRQAIGTRKPWLVTASRPFGVTLFRTLFRVEVRGGEHVPRSGPVLIAGNHTGFLDGPLVYALSPRSATFLTKSELFVGPLAKALGWLGQIPVHRGHPDRAALRAGLSVLQAGGALGVFPEGTRGAGTLEHVSDGLGYLALRSGAPIVPVAVLGTAEAMPKGSRFPCWRAPVRLVFGPAFALDVEGDPRARRTVGVAAEQIRLVMVAHLRDSQAPSPSSRPTPGTMTGLPEANEAADREVAPGRLERNA
jgi:1-acyl-sn-glycerol-3-phosphate acyltransferase